VGKQFPRRRGAESYQIPVKDRATNPKEENLFSTIDAMITDASKFLDQELVTFHEAYKGQQPAQPCKMMDTLTRLLR
jgi:hypothetical protein